MQFQNMVREVLQEDSERALTFDQVVLGFAKKFEPEIREALNALTKQGEVDTIPSGGMGQWRYKIIPHPVYRR
jgi:hypothetical protein